MVDMLAAGEGAEHPRKVADRNGRYRHKVDQTVIQLGIRGRLDTVAVILALGGYGEHPALEAPGYGDPLAVGIGCEGMFSLCQKALHDGELIRERSRHQRQTFILLRAVGDLAVIADGYDIERVSVLTFEQIDALCCAAHHFIDVAVILGFPRKGTDIIVAGTDRDHAERDVLKAHQSVQRFIRGAVAAAGIDAQRVALFGITARDKLRVTRLLRILDHRVGDRQGFDLRLDLGRRVKCAGKGIEDKQMCHIVSPFLQLR